ncbi:MAG: hypothetical protein WD333_13815 [Dehalococcoidia bacterium]
MTYFLSTSATTRSNVHPALLAFVLLLPVAFFITGCQAAKPVSVPAEFASLSFDELKDRATSPAYDDLFRNNEQYTGSIVHYKAQLIQVIEIGNRHYQFRASINEAQYFWEDIAFLRYEGPRLLDGDVIEFVGTVVGLNTYTAVLGNKITLPDISIIDSRRVGAFGDLPNTKSLVPTQDVTPPVLTHPTPDISPTPDIIIESNEQFAVTSTAWTEAWTGDRTIIGLIKNETNTVLNGVSATLTYTNENEHRVINTRDASILLAGEIGPGEVVPFVSGVPDDADAHDWNLLKIQVEQSGYPGLISRRVDGLEVQRLEYVEGQNIPGIGIQGGVRGIIHNGSTATLGSTEFLEGFDLAIVGYDAEDEVVFVGEDSVRTVLEPGWSADFELTIPGIAWGDPRLATRYEGRVLLRPDF